MDKSSMYRLLIEKLFFTNVFAKQIIVACGEGAKSSISAFEYLKYL